MKERMKQLPITIRNCSATIQTKRCEKKINVFGLHRNKNYRGSNVYRPIEVFMLEYPTKRDNITRPVHKTIVSYIISAYIFVI